MALRLKEKRKNGGYTMIELLTVTAVMAFITGLMMLNQNNFQGSIALSNLAHDIALAMRQAQVYATGVRKDSLGGFQSGYGVHFKYSATCSTNDACTTKFDLFTDLSSNKNRSYATSEFLREYQIKNRNFIKSICLITNSSNLTYPENKRVCAGTPSPVADYSLSTIIADITFMRPDTEACINNGTARDDGDSTNGAGVGVSSWCDGVGGTGYKSAEITIASASGKTKKIIVTSIGQISVQ